MNLPTDRHIQRHSGPIQTGTSTRSGQDFGECDWANRGFCPVGYSHRRNVLLGSLPRHEALPPKLKRDWTLVVDKFGMSSGGDLKLVHRTKPSSRRPSPLLHLAASVSCSSRRCFVEGEFFLMLFFASMFVIWGWQVRSRWVSQRERLLLSCRVLVLDDPVIIYIYMNIRTSFVVMLSLAMA
jgi:hypothetical protein